VVGSATGITRKTVVIAMTTRLLRIGVNVGMAKWPRVFNTAANSAAMPYKKIMGRSRYDSVVINCRSGSDVLALVSRAVNSGAHNTATTVAPARKTTARFSSRCAYASPRSASRVRARTSSGTTTLVRTPPSSSS
jgi:hypothetical protein